MWVPKFITFSNANLNLGLWFQKILCQSLTLYHFNSNTSRSAAAGRYFHLTALNLAQITMLHSIKSFSLFFLPTESVNSLRLISDRFTPSGTRAVEERSSPELRRAGQVTPATVSFGAPESYTIQSGTCKCLIDFLLLMLMQ